MKPIVNYGDVQPNSGEFSSPAPGGYVCKIVGAEDKPLDPNTGKGDYLWIEYDFAEGDFAGYHEDRFSRFGFWGGRLVKSYKEKALGMFKHFTNCVEESNSGFKWDWDETKLVGKLVGFVLGEEEYVRNDGAVGTRLYVKDVKTVDQIRNKEYKIPAIKKLKAEAAPAPTFTPVEVPNDDDLPF